MSDSLLTRFLGVFGIEERSDDAPDLNRCDCCGVSLQKRSKVLRDTGKRLWFVCRDCSDELDWLNRNLYPPYDYWEEVRDEQR